MTENPSLAAAALALRLEQARRWHNQDRAPAEEYLAQHPELKANPEYALELVYAELLLREEEGEVPRAEEFLRRFPQFASQLRRLFDVHTVVRSVCLADAGRSLPPGPDTPPGAGAETAAAGPALAGYEIFGELGRGGMGIVYKARQVALDRLVALKMVRGGALAGREEAARFRTEALAAARLRHPNTVQVYDVGEHDGCPFLALEFIDGGSLAHKLNGTPLTARRSAELVEALARAMHYAHGQGIVHRDLKPGNVLLTADGTPKITDFGLAKRLDGQAGMTGSGQLLGTPSYMAPEQAGGKAGAAGPAADVYALGAILYECLTGRPPFKAETALETLELVRDREPAPPHLLQPKVPRDPETICLKCLHKEPTRRYATALALAEDLARFLAGAPIQARPTHAWERGIKWARRRPARAGLLAVSILGPLVLLAVVLGFNVRLARANDDLKAALVAGDEKRREANENFRLARDAVDGYSTRVSQDPRLLAHDLEGLRKELLQLAVNFYATFVQQRPGDADVQAEQALALGHLARLKQELGSKQEAIERFQAAVGLLHKLVHEHPDVPSYRAHLAAAFNQLAVAYQELRQSDPAEAAYHEALGIRQQLVLQFPEEPVHQAQLASTHNNLALLYEETGRLPLAESTHGHARDAWVKLTQAHPGVEEYQSGLADSHFNLGLLYEKTSRLQLAEQSYRTACDLRRQLAHDHPGIPRYQDNLGVGLVNLGLVYVEAGRAGEALKAYGEARGIYQKLTDEHPKVPGLQDQLARVHHNLGHAYADLHRWPEAETAYGEACRLREPLVRDHPQVPDYGISLARTQNVLGLLFCNTGRPKRASTPLANARQIQEKLVRNYPNAVDFRVSLGNTYSSLGLMEIDLGRHQQALDWLGQSVRALEAILQQEPRQTFARRFLKAAYDRRVQSLTQLGRHDEALRDLERLLELEDGVKSDSWRSVHADALARMGRHGPAMAEVDALIARPSLPAATWYNLACACALCSAAVRQDAQLGQAEQGRRAELYAARAVALLKKAAAAGFFQTPDAVEQMRKDKDLELLRQRRDFQDLFPLPHPRP
jgi:serine/threonine protein kinase/tetratricopeptide (TPR) repeat protein